MATNQEKFTEIATAIRSKTYTTDGIVANDFAETIKTIDAMRPMTTYDTELENGFWGNRAAQVAASYQQARILGTDAFYYAWSNFFHVAGDDGSIGGGSDEGTEDESNSSDDDYTGDAGTVTAGSSTEKIGDKSYRVRQTALTTVTDADGNETTDTEPRGLIDCSGFVGLVLRGIQYSNSPFSQHKELGECWVPSEEMPEMYGTEGWEFPVADKQMAGVYNNLGFSGYSSLRTAADLAEFFYKTGYVVWDSKYDEPYGYADVLYYDGSTSNASEMPTVSQLCNRDLYKLFKPGDLIFWAKASASTNQKLRFRGISHVGIVGEREDRILHVTTGSSVVLCSNFTQDYRNSATSGNLLKPRFSEIALVIRPNYVPAGESSDVPLGVNLCRYPWNYGATLESATSGVTYTNVEPALVAAGDYTVEADGLWMHGTSTAAYTRTLKGSSNDTGYIRLTPGSYMLGGMEGTGVKGTAFALHVRDSDGNDFATSIRAYDGTNATFTITEEQRVMIRLYLGNGRTVDTTIYPWLIRTA